MTTDPKPADSASTAITENPPAPVPVPPSSPRSPWPFRVDMAILALLLILSFFLASFSAANSDLWMHLAIGKRITEGKYEFGVDPFSWATEAHEGAAATYWVNQSWLFSWLAYQLYQIVGGAGLVVIKALAFTAAIALLCRIGWSNTNRWFVLICLMMAALAVSGRQLLLLQPMVVSYLFLAITMFVLDRAGVFRLAERASDRTTADPSLALPANAETRALWWLPPLFLLWANLDAWFILGPIVLGLCWAASGLAKWFRGTSAVPGQTLGLVFGAGLAACVVNPHHVHVFQLPPELAYAVLSVTDAVGAPMPAEMVAAGRTLKEFQKADTPLPWLASTLSPSYWRNPRVGLNVAGLAVYPLILLGLLSFTLTALIKPQEKAPTLHATRFLLWLFFGVLALSMYRLVPFFALVAAPLTAMTLGEFLDWQQTCNAVTTENRERGMRLARPIAVMFMLLLVFLAWPGWLHGTTEFNSHRRVAWEMRLDGSLERTAKTLQALHEKGECGNVFNANFDLGNCLPWFAPDVKHFADTRFALYAGHAMRYTGVQRWLYEPNLENTREWQRFFVEHQIKQFAASQLLDRGRIQIFWLNPDHWRERYGDGFNFVFSWSGAKQPWPTNTVRDDRDRQAFGPVAVEDRPPAKGAPAPQTQTPWTLYLEGTGPEPVTATRALVLKDRFLLDGKLEPFFGMMSFRAPKEAGPRPSASILAFSASLCGLQALTDGATVPHSLASLLNSWTVLAPRDVGPPALPILAVRAARQAVAENPLSERSHLALNEATEMLRNMQEDHWIGFQRRPRQDDPKVLTMFIHETDGIRYHLFPKAQHPSSLRESVRQAQQVASVYHRVQVQPDDPNLHMTLANLYLQQNCVDLALDHMEAAYKNLESSLSSGPNAPKDPKQRDAALRRFADTGLKPLIEKVQMRQAKFKENTGKGTPLQKAGYAIRGPYIELVEGKQEGTSLGLAKAALEIVTSIEPDKLTKDEALPFDILRLDLLIQTGQAGVVATYLKDSGVLHSAQAGIYAPYQLFAAAALGDYESVDQALSTIEEAQRQNLKRAQEETNNRRRDCVSVMMATPSLQSMLPLAVSQVLPSPAFVIFHQAQAMEHGTHASLCNTITLRGIFALEAGETKRAHEIFRAALKEGGTTVNFSDRGIANRYAELLERGAK